MHAGIVRKMEDFGAVGRLEPCCYLKKVLNTIKKPFFRLRKPIKIKNEGKTK